MNILMKFEVFIFDIMEFNLMLFSLRIPLLSTLKERYNDPPPSLRREITLQEGKTYITIIKTFTLKGDFFKKISSKAQEMLK